MRDVWEYAGVLYPDNALSFANLGNLYAFYLHNNVKAELNFKKLLKMILTSLVTILVLLISIRMFIQRRKQKRQDFIRWYKSY